MAGNVGAGVGVGVGVGVGDEESQLSNRVQPFSSTPRSEDWKNKDVKNKSSSSSLGEWLGMDEFYSQKVWRASMGELIGTAVLVFSLDTIVITSIEIDTKSAPLVMSILIAMIVTILLIAVHPVSGGHINPIITFAAMLLGLIPFSRTFIYILAQCIGGVIGALALKAVVGSSIEHAFTLGGCALSVTEQTPTGLIKVGIETSPGLWLEIICTFIFLFASVYMVYDARQEKDLGFVKVRIIVGIVVGLLVYTSSTVTAKKGYAGVGMNPARCIGPALVRGGHLWDDHWVFWVGPTIGSLAFYLYVKIIPRQHFQD